MTIQFNNKILKPLIKVHNSTRATAADEFQYNLEDVLSVKVKETGEDDELKSINSITLHKIEEEKLTVQIAFNATKAIT